MNEMQAIQIAFPNEPDWSAVSKEALIALVEDYISEQSCATAALCELSRRKYDGLGGLCEFLLDAPVSDRRLRAFAMAMLLSHSPSSGFDRAHALVDDCDATMLSEIVMALNYEQQGPLAQIVTIHPVVSKVKHRLTHFKADEFEFVDAFYQRFGD